MLVDHWLVRRAAVRANVMPTELEVRAYWQQLLQQLRAEGRSPQEFAALRNASEEQWLRDLALPIAQERLVRAELELPPGEVVSGDMMKLWMQELRKTCRIETDPDALPPGVAARVDGTDIPMIDLGMLLLRTSEDREREQFVRQVVYLECLEALARRHGVAVTEADLQASIAARRAEAARDPRFQGLSFEQLLQSQHQTIASLQRSRVFRAQVLLHNVAAKLHPTAALMAEIARDRPQALAIAGPRRQLGVIFLRALEPPNALVPRDFAAATKDLEHIAQRLHEERFEVVARIESDDAASKQNGGDAGWQPRRGGRLPDVVADAAFALGRGGTSAPIRAADGCWLVKVLDVEPEPTDEQLVVRLREIRAQELSRTLLAEAAIEHVAAAAAPPARR
jgi:hypothetical protein